MQIHHFMGLIIIMLLLSACSVLNNFKKTPLQENRKIQKAKYSITCPLHYISEYNTYAPSKNNEKFLKLHSVKLECELDKNNKNLQDNKVIIKQTIYYQILNKDYKNKINLTNAKIFVSLVNEKNKKVIFKALSKVRVSSPSKVKGKFFFKNVDRFRFSLDKNNKNLYIYYGFQD